MYIYIYLHERVVVVELSMEGGLATTISINYHKLECLALILFLISLLGREVIIIYCAIILYTSAVYYTTAIVLLVGYQKPNTKISIFKP